VLIKSADDKAVDIQTLETLLVRPDVTKATAKRIELEMTKIRAGAKAERDAAYQIDFYLRDGTNFAVIHDLRIEHGGRPAGSLSAKAAPGMISVTPAMQAAASAFFNICLPR